MFFEITVLNITKNYFDSCEVALYIDHFKLYNSEEYKISVATLYFVI